MLDVYYINVIEYRSGGMDQTYVCIATNNSKSFSCCWNRKCLSFFPSYIVINSNLLSVSITACQPVVTMYSCTCNVITTLKVLLLCKTTRNKLSFPNRYEQTTKKYCYRRVLNLLLNAQIRDVLRGNILLVLTEGYQSSYWY